MALTRSQQQIAQLIMGIGARRGLSPQRQRELAAASYAESGLNPRAINKSSGAAGLFQLLSSGYRNRAQQLGGLQNPRANTLAIINDYVNYWRSHPGAAPGAAGRDVERSGEGAGFYAKGLPLLGGVGPGPPSVGGGASPLSVPPAAPGAPAGNPNAAALVSQRLLSGLGSGQQVNWLSLARLAAQRQAPQKAAQTVAGPEPVATKDGNFVDPVTGKVIGTPYHGTHTLGNWESDRALDISVPIGTPVRAPFAGVVGSQFGSLGTSGRFQGLRLHVGNPQNEWYGAHLSRYAPGIKPGRRVRAGQVVGFSGSASGVAHLHEAIRSGDPYSLIR